MIEESIFSGREIRYDVDGYAFISVGKKNKFCHVLVWEKANGPKPKGFDIHHIDGNKANFKLSNLELLTRKDHKRTHFGWIKTDGVWTHKPCRSCKEVLPLDKFYKIASGTEYYICKACSLGNTSKYRTVNKAKIAERAAKAYYQNHEESKEQVKIKARQYREKNSEKINAKRRENYSKYPDKIRERSRKRYHILKNRVETDNGLK